MGGKEYPVSVVREEDEVQEAEFRCAHGRGGLPPGPGRGLMLELASQQASGALVLTDPDGEEATVWFREGLVYAVSVPGRAPCWACG